MKNCLIILVHVNFKNYDVDKAQHNEHVQVINIVPANKGGLEIVDILQ